MRTPEYLRAEVRGCAGGGAHVRLAGELDLLSAASVGELLGSLAGTHVDVDLAELSFIDARGLACFVRAAAIQRRSGRSFSLRGATPAIRRVFELVGLDEMLSDERSVPCGASAIVPVAPDAVLDDRHRSCATGNPGALSSSPGALRASPAAVWRCRTTAAPAI